jgi:DNA-binding MurR/RpiR family transcriptional regulator
VRLISGQILVKSLAMKLNSYLNQISQTALASSPALEKIGLWMAAHPLRVISMSAEEVAIQSGGSLAAVNRFARSAGFDGFSQLKSLLAVELHEASEPIRKLIPVVGKQASDNSEDDSAQSMMVAENNVRMTKQALKAADIDIAAQRLLQTRKTFTLGLGLGNAMAYAAAHLLQPYLQSVIQLAGEGGTEVAARRLLRISSEDTLLAVSLPRYSRDTVSLARYAKERGAYVIAITDKPAAPLAAYADCVLLAHSTHTTLSSSGVAMLSVIEALATRVMQLNPDAVRLATELSEAVLEHLSVGNQKPLL